MRKIKPAYSRIASCFVCSRIKTHGSRAPVIDEECGICGEDLCHIILCDGCTSPLCSNCMHTILMGNILILCESCNVFSVPSLKIISLFSFWESSHHKRFGIRNIPRDLQETTIKLYEAFYEMRDTWKYLKQIKKFDYRVLGAVFINKNMAREALVNIEHFI